MKMDQILLEIGVIRHQRATEYQRLIRVWWHELFPG